MTDKEWLEEIKSRVWKDKGTYAMGDCSQREGYIYTLSDYDYEWLIEQAARVEELEKELDSHKNKFTYKYTMRIREENKRYKKALEEVLITDEFEDPQDYIDRIVTKASEALEESE